MLSFLISYLLFDIIFIVNTIYENLCEVKDEKNRKKR